MKRVLFLLLAGSPLYGMFQNDLYTVLRANARENYIPIACCAGAAVAMYTGHQLLRPGAPARPVELDTRCVEEIMGDFEELVEPSSRFGTVSTETIRGLARTESLNRKSKGTFWAGVLQARLDEERDHPERFSRVPMETTN